ncbi:hypothetical protein DPMN_045661 [Dreissena polymorpha]|uniref:Uncharacterized protein n=1 Tax=Dreissena polymorpha TaxID=45954 RepID=A0A9D4D6G2_DREPO|nr:hypothetical protein DPMN_045661 [Dreissena polymorpha]
MTKVKDAPKKLLLLRSNAEIEEITVESKDDLTRFTSASIGDLLKTMDEEASTTKRISSQRHLKTNGLHLLNIAAHLFAINDSEEYVHKACFRITSVKLVPLPNGWKTKQTVTVDISIAKVCAYQGFMLARRLCLVCDLSEYEINPGESSRKLHTLQVPLVMRQINILHFLLNKGEYEELLNAEECTEHYLQKINLARYKTG